MAVGRLVVTAARRPAERSRTPAPAARPPAAGLPDTSFHAQ
jgi:hypothetical protein